MDKDEDNNGANLGNKRRVVQQNWQNFIFEKAKWYHCLRDDLES